MGYGESNSTAHVLQSTNGPVCVVTVSEVVLMLPHVQVTHIRVRTAHILSHTTTQHRYVRPSHTMTSLAQHTSPSQTSSHHVSHSHITPPLIIHSPLPPLTFPHWVADDKGPLPMLLHADVAVEDLTAVVVRTTGREATAMTTQPTTRLHTAQQQEETQQPSEGDNGLRIPGGGGGG